MTTHVLRGSKQEIVESIARLSGEVREAIVFVEDPARNNNSETADVEDIFAEMGPFMVDVSDVDDTRQAIYSRMEGE
jgi:hypothetical protein